MGAKKLEQDPDFVALHLTYQEAPLMYTPATDSDGNTIFGVAALIDCQFPPGTDRTPVAASDTYYDKIFDEWMQIGVALGTSPHPTAAPTPHPTLGWLP